MAVKEILRREAEKMFHEACLDRGFTKDQVLLRQNILVRNAIIKKLDKAGFTQSLIAELIGRSERAVRTILKGVK